MSDEAVIAITSASAEMLGFDMTSSDHLSDTTHFRSVIGVIAGISWKSPTFGIPHHTIEIELLSSFPEWVPSSIALARAAEGFVISERIAAMGTSRTLAVPWI